MCFISSLNENRTDKYISVALQFVNEDRKNQAFIFSFDLKY